MKVKMKKSGNNEPSNFEISDAVKIRALENERNYWKLRYDLVKKYPEVL